MGTDQTGRSRPRSALRTGARTAAGVLGAGVLAGAGALAWGHFVELNRFQLREETLAVLPPGSPDLRILHVSDLHMIPGQRRKTAFVHSLAALEPDLVINTGDNFSHPEALPPLLEALAPLLEFPGAYVPGSNCYFAPQPKNPSRYLWRDTSGEAARKAEDHRTRLLPWREMHRAFDDAGWHGLVNRTDSLEVRGVRLDFSGVDDPHLGYDRHPGFSPEALHPDPAVPSVRVGVAHAPYLRTLDRFAEDGAQVIFAGHTHGGQICLPGGHAVVSNCDLEPARAKGVSFQQGVPVQVSAGLGTSRYAAVRLFCPPEAVLVTLTARPA